MSRTKAEAAANPQAGDRWRGFVRATCSYYHKTVDIVGHKTLFFVLESSGGMAFKQQTVEQFQDWSEDCDAEFLGGADENEG